jgi:hypothetical protein
MTRELAFYSMIAGMTGHPCQRLFFVDAKWPLPTPSGLPARVPSVGFHPGRLNRMRRRGANDSEFTKFVILVRDLGPFVILLVDPSNRSRRQDRSAAVTRRNLEFILNGHPDAVPLFN